MKILIIALIAFAASGCSTRVKIHEAKVIGFDQHSLKVQVTTDKALPRFDGSFWAHRVYLDYEPENKSTTPASNEKAVVRSFVFSAQRVEPWNETPDGGFISCWSLPMSGRFSWSITDYSYHLKSGETVLLRVAGGTMHGTALKSNEVGLKVPDLSEASGATEAK